MAGSAISDGFPNYSIRVDQSPGKGNVAALFGSAQGTYSVKGNLPIDLLNERSGSVTSCQFAKQTVTRTDST
jgi:hypothetical protein